jgi:hypothetical protein
MSTPTTTRCWYSRRPWPRVWTSLLSPRILAGIGCCGHGWGAAAGCGGGARMHPLRVAEASMAEVARVRRLLPQATWVGEVGLDFSRAGAATRNRQLRVAALLAARRHSRRAEREVVDPLLDARVRAVLNWYTAAGDRRGRLRRRSVVSINPAMAASTRSSALLARLPPAGYCSKRTDHSPGKAAAQPARRPGSAGSAARRAMDGVRRGGMGNHRRQPVAATGPAVTHPLT